MRKFILLIATSFCFHAMYAQDENAPIAKGNKAYQAQEFDKAATEYKNALQVNPGSTIARFNLGNALFRANNHAEAEKAFDETIERNHSPQLTASSWYNKGVVLTNQKKLEESIKAYKQALRVNPSDTLARENLVRALREIQQKQQQEKDQKKKQDQEKKKENDQKKQQKMNKQQVQQLLQALEEQEKRLQQKMNQSKVPAPSQPDKDW